MSIPWLESTKAWVFLLLCGGKGAGGVGRVYKGVVNCKYI